MNIKQREIEERYKVTRCISGKDARLYVYRLSTLKRGIEERQLVRTKCDSRENKLEKTRGMRSFTSDPYKLLCHVM